MEGKPNKEQVAIIGAGIAGLEAAHQLLRLGYAPVLIEQADHAGGHVAEWNRLFPDKAPAAPLVEELLEQTREATLILRAKILRETGDAVLSAYMESRIGQTAVVLTETAEKGLCEHYLSVKIDRPSPVGAYVPVRLTGICETGVYTGSVL